MKKILTIIVLVWGFVFNASADENVRVSNLTYPNSTTVTVSLQMTSAAKQKYNIVYVKVVPKGKTGIVEGVKYVTVYQTGGTVIFECEEGKANQCKAYDFDVITTEVESK